jgi:hypothetical protein
MSPSHRVTAPRLRRTLILVNGSPVRPTADHPSLDKKGNQTVNHVTIEALDGIGRAIAIDMSIKRDWVEGWANDRCWAVFNRELLRAWLASPSGSYAVEGITLGCTKNRVALTVDQVVSRWELSPRELERLRQWV